MARYLRSSASCLSNFDVLIFRIKTPGCKKGDAQRTACAQDRDRTGTVSLPLVFETSASTNSATWATSANCATKVGENSELGKSQNDTLPKGKPKRGNANTHTPAEIRRVLTETQHALVATRHATSLLREKDVARFQQVPSETGEYLEQPPTPPHSSPAVNPAAAPRAGKPLGSRYLSAPPTAIST